MTIEITEELLSSVLQHISENPRATAVCDLKGDREQNLLAVRELRRRGLITGAFLDDSTRPGDQHGAFLYDAARLEPR